MSDNQQGRIPKHFYDISRHPQPNFEKTESWWMRFR